MPKSKNKSGLGKALTKKRPQNISTPEDARFFHTPHADPNQKYKNLKSTL